ncbi:MAG TPA: 4a-hydroxytetrahydrobiopterin dehydratase [Anaerolineaceae bacterium]|nr:4a-hydroxytetrahydrobiopterin dehydratase [Anaerolineaceae bacterium]
MDELSKIHCVPINSTSKQLSEVEITQLEKKLTGWLRYRKEDELRLEKSFKFKDFNQAMAFTILVAQEAEKEDHHPAILTEWANVTVTWWTHKVKGLHQNDFIMAAKTDLLFVNELTNKKE